MTTYTFTSIQAVVGRVLNARDVRNKAQILREAQRFLPRALLSAMLAEAARSQLWAAGARN